MKKKILCLLLLLTLALSAFVACGGNNGPTPGPDPEPGPGPKPNPDDEPIEEGDWWSAITYENTELRFQMTHCSNNEQLSSGCERYLAGENVTEPKDLDDLIAQRNEDAYFNTNVTVKYLYYPDAPDSYGWTKNIDVIFNEVMDGASDSPDMYCNFMSDMLTTSLKGSFANLYSKVRGTGEQAGVNFIIPDAEIGNVGYAHSGYMSDLMSSLTLSSDKIYCIASDYFIDLIRAFFVIPVNRALYNSIAPEMIDDLDGSGTKDMNDLFVEVENGDWTYDRMIAYCGKIFKPTSGLANANINDTLGFALSNSDGLPASGLLYTTDIEIIQKSWSDEKGGYVYYYPGSTIDNFVNDNPEDLIHKKYSDVDYDAVNNNLFNFADKLTLLFQSRGVAIADGTSVRTSFTKDTMLFGGVILVGSLEYEYYQQMKGGERGFGVLPLPLYKPASEYDQEKFDGAWYQTQIHTIGRCGGISHITTKFAQCTAFIQYQSTHSTEILNEYYDRNLTLDVSGDIGGNVRMLQYIRTNVRTAFDKLFEDAIGLFFQSIDGDSTANRWHHQIMSNNYQIDMRKPYDELKDTKQNRLLDLEAEYDRLPD
jgi:hypothetical protein